MSDNNLSYPKDKINILLLEKISHSAVKIFQDNDYVNIDARDGAMTEDELVEAIKDVHLIGIRSKTKITRKVLEAADKLLAVGAFCIGTNQIDLEAAAEMGIAVFNSPFSNTRSVAELVVASSVFLIRRIPEKSRAAYEGKWLKEAKGAHEIRSKTLGIVGFGNIGSQVAALAEGMGMKVIYFDLEPKLSRGNSMPVDSMDELLAESDILSLHVPQHSSTANLIGKEEIKKMKAGAHLINFSRGNVVDLDALADAIKDGRMGGAAIDVFPVEPKEKGASFECPLQGLDNVILTPHIGGSTEEAQWNIGMEVAYKLVSFVDEGKSVGSVSIPELSLPKMEDTRRVLNIHRNVPGVIRQLNQLIHEQELNVVGQYLQTNSSVGYVVVDVQGKASRESLESLGQIDETIKHRILY